MADGINISPTKMMVASVLGIAGLGIAISAGTEAGSSLELSWSFLALYCIVFVPTVVGALYLDRRKSAEMRVKMLARRNGMKQIASKYNAVIGLLEKNYRSEKRELGFLGSSVKKEELRARYEALYQQNKQAYQEECRRLAQTNDVHTPESRKMLKWWKKLLAAAFLTQMIACGYTFGTAMQEDSTPAAAVMSEPADTRAWSAETIELPHTTDGLRYVSNPDQVVSQNTETLLNQWLRKLDDSLQIETAMILVNHVANDDPYRMAQDVGNRYGVGKDDRGLVIVLGYLDHSINISPGKSLEADLTDVECRRLQQEYVVPCMKAEMPDSGMLYLTEAIYNTLKKKELPVMHAFSKSQAEEESDEAMGIVSIYLLLFAAWSILAAFVAHRYSGIGGLNMLRSNPFVRESVYVGGGGGGHSSGGGSWGGGGGFSGGYSGGSFGGGGATSRW